MTITLELRPEEVTALQDRALAESVDIETLLHRLIAQMASLSASQAGKQPEFLQKQEGLTALNQAWRNQGETEDPEELADRDRELEELKANMLRWRAEEGRGPVSP